MRKYFTLKRPKPGVPERGGRLATWSLHLETDRAKIGPLWQRLDILVFETG